VNDYRPIDCALHDSFEAQILRGRPVRARWRDAERAAREGVILPPDRQTGGAAEYLTAGAPDGQPPSLRLDRVQGPDPIP
jgi:Rho-binding antiterminator